jgi:hypothetical protein
MPLPGKVQNALAENATTPTDVKFDDPTQA